MNSATIKLIIALLPLAERLVFDLGGKLIEINTKDLTDPDEIAKALDAAQAEGFPQLKFVSGVDSPASPVSAAKSETINSMTEKKRG